MRPVRPLVLLVIASVLFPSFAAAQAYPAKAVRVIIPHPPGGPGDVPPRGIAQALTQAMGQPFIVENREGADGLIGAEAAAKAAPDGYTLLQTSVGTMVINRALRKDANYDASRFVAIIHTGAMQQLILATVSVPANSMKDLLELAKAKPESIAIGTYGQINLASVFAEWARAELGVRFYPVPFKSASQSLQSAMAGDVQVVSYAVGPVLKLIRSGKLKAFAICPKADPALLPGVPGLRDSGVNFDFTTWWGWFAPLGTPREIVVRLNAEIGKIIVEPTFKAKFFDTQGIVEDTVTGAPPEVFDKYVKSEVESFARLMNTIGLKPQ
jgi:tripartite-type tricarboxylate transporter receptor subunit TctC